jgi:hypothetical protein
LYTKVYALKYIYYALDRLSNTQEIFMTRLAIFLSIKTIFNLSIT